MDVYTYVRIRRLSVSYGTVCTCDMRRVCAPCVCWGCASRWSAPRGGLSERRICDPTCPPDRCIRLWCLAWADGCACAMPREGRGMSRAASWCAIIYPPHCYAWFLARSALRKVNDSISADRHVEKSHPPGTYILAPHRSHSSMKNSLSSETSRVTYAWLAYGLPTTLLFRHLEMHMHWQMSHAPCPMHLPDATYAYGYAAPAARGSDRASSARALCAGLIRGTLV